MEVRFWGTRGSLPAPLNAQGVRKKIVAALSEAVHKGLSGAAGIEALVDSLSFSVRGTFGGNTACVEIVNGSEAVFCDAGSGLRDYALHGPKSPEGRRDYHIFLSHLHWDHICGFPFFTPAYVPGNRVFIYGCHSNMREAFAFQQSDPHFPVSLSSMGAEISFTTLEPGRGYDIAGFRVTALGQEHPGGSFAYSFSRAGRKMVYATDVELRDQPDKKDLPIHSLIQECDLLIFDAQYSYLEAMVTKENWGHSSNLIAVELAVASGVKTLALFHHDPAATDEDLARTLTLTREYLSIHAPQSAMSVYMAYDGMFLSI
ncbi:MAG: MBL fold metallo-hydrolase [Thermodesulfobacteriota bacterium]